MEKDNLFVTIYYYNNKKIITIHPKFSELFKEIQTNFPNISLNKSEYVIYYYPEDDKNKKIINNDESTLEYYNNVKEEKFKDPKIYLINTTSEKKFFNTSNEISKSIIQSNIINITNSYEISKISSSIMLEQSAVFSNLSKIFKRVSEIQEDNINNQIKNQLTYSFMKIPEDSSKKVIQESILTCILCNQTINSLGYFRCIQCPNFIICKECEFRFQNTNIHSHELIYAIQGKEENIEMNYIVDKKLYTYEEVEKLVSDSKKSLRYENEDEYLGELIEKDDVNGLYQVGKKDNFVTVKVTYKNLGEKTWDDRIQYKSLFNKMPWVLKGKNIINEWTVNKKEKCESGNNVTITFKININEKAFGVYYCIMGLKRGEKYVIKGTETIFKVNINLVGDDYHELN